MDSLIYVHMKEPAVRVLGPGLRYVLWVQGCERRCPGCTAPTAWDMRKGDPIPAAALAWEIALSGAEGLTISGGEPFLQAGALGRMVELIRRRRDMGVIVYTGFLYEELLGMDGAQALLSRTDLLIDGPYIREMDDGRSLRGSSNQRVLPLTERYHSDLYLYGAEGRPIEHFQHGVEIHDVGVADHLKGIEQKGEKL